MWWGGLPQYIVITGGLMYLSALRAYFGSNWELIVEISEECAWLHGGRKKAVEIIVGDGGRPSTPTSMWGLTTSRRLSTLIICSFALCQVTWCCGFLVRWALKSMYMADLSSWQIFRLEKTHFSSNGSKWLRVCFLDVHLDWVLMEMPGGLTNLNEGHPTLRG
jgi:hypothetical protein